MEKERKCEITQLSNVIRLLTEAESVELHNFFSYFMDKFSILNDLKRNQILPDSEYLLIFKILLLCPVQKLYFIYQNVPKRLH